MHILQPLTFARITKAEHPLSKASRSTKYRCNKQAQNLNEVLTCNDASALLREEIQSLSCNEKNDLLKKAGIKVHVISPEQGLAIKANLTIPWPWNKIRVI